MIDPPRWSGYSVESEPIVIINTDPTQNAAWVSPSDKIISEGGEFSKYFNYTDNPGSITYIGEYDVLVEAVGFPSTQSAANGVEARLKWAKNNLPEADSGRYVVDLIGNQNTSALLGISQNFILTKGDFLDFFFGCDTLTTLNMMKSEWKIKTLAILQIMQSDLNVGDLDVTFIDSHLPNDRAGSEEEYDKKDLTSN